MTNNQPLVTFALFAYNQEKYISEAIEGALSQTYAPMEIILSDDCSSDRTFDIMKELASSYQGPHTIRCNRNNPNLGIARHVNRVNEMAQGELIVVAAGDDISVPERVVSIVDAYLKSKRQSHYFYSVVQKINEAGETLELAQSPGSVNAHSKLLTGLSSFPLAIGAGQAWTKKLTTTFRPLLSHVWAEDQILGLRGRLMGDVGSIDTALVYYRVGVGISTKNKQFSVGRYFNARYQHSVIFLQRSLDAYAKKNYFVALVVLIKAAALFVALPVSPLISIINRLLSRHKL